MTNNRATRAIVALLIGVAAAAVAAGPVSAQEGCDAVYGCQPTSTATTAPPVTPSCSVDPSSGEVGAAATADVDGVPTGTALDLEFNGEVVASGVAGADGPAGYGSAELTFNVPGVASGRYSLVATGSATFVDCGGFEVVSAEEVLSAGVERGRDAGAGGGSALARTGMAVGTLVAIAAGLIVGGRTLRRRDRGTPGAAR